MIDFTEIPEDGETWELFARDFLQELGFFIESSPDRGPDGGKDLIVTEELKGTLGNYKFRWLVSCKHFAHSRKSVQEKDELNIVERLESFKADGFIGFYSTIPSSGLNDRLNELKEKSRIKDYRVFDQSLIENHLIRVGFSQILMRYLPLSYKAINPLHVVVEKYMPLECAACGKDLLESLYYESYKGLIGFVTRPSEPGVSVIRVEDIYWACKGACDKQMQAKYAHKGLSACFWNDVSDLIVPALFLNWIFGLMRHIREGHWTYSDTAFEKLVDFSIGISQKVLREMSAKDRERANTVLAFPF